jgi:hypothetical protein
MHAHDKWTSILLAYYIPPTSRKFSQAIGHSFRGRSATRFNTFSIHSSKKHDLLFLFRSANRLHRTISDLFCQVAQSLIGKKLDYIAFSEEIIGLILNSIFIPFNGSMVWFPPNFSRLCKLHLVSGEVLLRWLTSIFGLLFGTSRQAWNFFYL